MSRTYSSITSTIFFFALLMIFFACTQGKKQRAFVGSWQAIPSSLEELSDKGLETKQQQLSLQADGTAMQYLVLRLAQSQSDHSSLSDTVYLEYAVHLSGKWQIEGEALHLVFPPDEVSVRVLELKGAQLSTYLDTASQANIDAVYSTTQTSILDEWTKKLKAEASNGVYWLEPIVRNDTLELTDRTLGVIHFVRTQSIPNQYL